MKLKHFVDVFEVFAHPHSLIRATAIEHVIGLKIDQVTGSFGPNFFLFKLSMLNQKVFL